MRGVVTSWFSCGLSDAELSALAIERGSCRSQQAVEALAALVALRCWAAAWQSRRCQLRLRSDSISALILVLKLKTSGKATGIVARELALDIASSAFAPTLAEHVPGIANDVCDILSRRFEPGKAFVIPRCLAQVPELVLETRGLDYFRTLRDPPSPSARDSAAPA